MPFWRPNGWPFERLTIGPSPSRAYGAMADTARELLGPSDGSQVSAEGVQHQSLGLQPVLDSHPVRDENLQPPVVGQLPTDRYFQLGLADGYAGSDIALGRNVVAEANRPELLRLHDSTLHQALSDRTAEKRWLDLHLKQRKERLRRASEALKRCDSELADIRKRKAQRRQDLCKAADEFEQRRGFSSAIIRLFGGGPRDNDEPLASQNALTRTAMGLILTAIAAVVVLADVAISLGALYSFGFTDDALPLGMNVFSREVLFASWMPLAICAAIAGITFIYKYVYERWKYRAARPLHAGEGVVLWTLTLVATATVIVLAYTRADFYETSGRIPAPEQFNRAFAKAGMVLSMLLFSVLGAVLLSEGLSAFLNGLGELLQGWVPHRESAGVRRRYYSGVETLVELEDAISAKAREIIEARGLVDNLEGDIANQEREGIALEESMDLLSSRVEELEIALKNQGRLCLSLYEHGYRLGLTLRLSIGPYDLLCETLGRGLDPACLVTLQLQSHAGATTGAGSRDEAS